jgi:CRISPR system Cascade subunit CasD
MSFGGVAVDDVLRTDEWMSRSQLAGSIGNGFGWDRSSSVGDRNLDRLQSRIRYAMCQYDAGRRIEDFVQATLLGEGDEPSDHYRDFYVGDNFVQKFDTNKALRIRHKEYLSGADYWVAFYLTSERENPTLDEVAHALRYPQRTLYLGRLCCIPADRILQGIVEADHLADAFKKGVELGIIPQSKRSQLKYAWMDGDKHAGFKPRTAKILRMYGDRDWERNVHTGHYVLKEAML